MKVSEGIIGSGTYLYGYDTYSRQISVQDALGHTTQFGYDNWGRKVTVINPDNTQLKISYDDIYRTQTSTDAENNQYLSSYDLLNRLTKKEWLKPSGSIQLAKYDYDFVGNAVNTVDGNGNSTKYKFDVFSRLISVTDALAQTTNYSYNYADKITQIKYSDGNMDQKLYDALGRLVQKVDSTGQIEKYYYDLNNNLIKHLDRKGQTQTFTYDQRNRLSQNITAKETISYTYDAAGRRLSMTDVTGTTFYSYDTITKLLNKVAYPDNKTTQYQYDVQGNLKQLTDPFNQNTFYNYDVLNRLTNVGPTLNTWDATYTYKANSLLSTILNNNGVSASYSYDGGNLTNLTERNSSGTVINTFNYGYDNNSNQTSRVENGQSNSFTYDPLNRINTSSQFAEQYSYNSRGNRQTLQTSGTVNINPGNNQYDERNRLIQVNKPDGSSVAYKYNGDGLLWERTENGQTTRYYNNGADVIAEGNVVNGVAALKARYIRGKGLVAREDSARKSYYLHNGHGDVVNLMDSTGMSKLNSYSYDIWGNIVSQTESIAQPFRYSGEMFDDSTGLQYLRARWYDPSMGRFINEDSYEGQIDNPLSLNLYTYVQNNPLTNVDPTRHWCESSDGNYAHAGGCYGTSDKETFADVGGSHYSADFEHDGDLTYSAGKETGIYEHIEGAHEDHTWTGVVFDTVVTGGVGASGKLIKGGVSKLFAKIVGAEIAESLAYSGVRNTAVDFMNAKGKSTLARHLADHADDFGVTTESEYLNAANNFLLKKANSTTKAFTSNEGTYFRYDTATNEFGIINKFGGISTYFKPGPGLEYWLEQVSKYAPK